MGIDPRTKDRVFALLKAKGATKAVVSFSGGGDEGGTDSITLHSVLKNDEVVEHDLEVWYGGYNGKQADTEDQELSGLLQDPIDEQYGGFAGEFHVSGTLTWDAEAGTVTMEKSESVESYEHSTEEW